MPLFETAEALTDFLDSIATQAVADTGKKIVEIVKENVRAIVYDPYTLLVRKYTRMEENGGFLGSWTQNVDFSNDGNPQTLIFSDPARIDVSPPSHGQAFEDDSSQDFRISALDKMGGSGEGDRSKYMDEAIATGTHWDYYVEDDSPNWHGKIDNWWTRPRDYFSPSLRRIDREKTVEKTAESSFRTRNSGIKIIKAIVN